MDGYQSFAEYYDILTQNIAYDKRAAYFSALFARFGKQEGILLDLACGTGSLTEELAALGWDMIGADGSPAMLTQAAAKKYASGRDILYLCQEMDEIDLFGRIDCCVCALDSINHVTDPEAVRRIFQRVALFLEPDGLFAFDVNTLYKHEKILSGETFVYDMDEVFCVWQNSLCQKGVVEITLDLFGAQEDGSYFRQTEHFSERAYTDAEIRSFLAQAGFTLLGCYAEDSFDPPAADSQRLIYLACAKKPLKETESRE